MRSRWLMGAGMLCLLIGGANIASGFTGKPWLTLAGGILGVIFLMASLLSIRSEIPQSATHDPAREQRIVRVVTAALSAFGIVAALVAILVAEGEAQGHAVGHFLTGLVCLGLFAALAFPWHPAAGTALAGVRGLVLVLLVAATFGSFLESLGGSGYDAANSGESDPGPHDVARHRPPLRRARDGGRPAGSHHRGRRARHSVLAAPQARSGLTVARRRQRARLEPIPAPRGAFR